MLVRFEFVTLTYDSLSTVRFVSREHRHTGSRFGCDVNTRMGIFRRTA
jgi:hypothetical protein